jgi:haloacetate dehalogenase
MTLDREGDAADREARRRIEAPTLVLWSTDSPLDEWYADAAARWRTGPGGAAQFYP